MIDYNDIPLKDRESIVSNLKLDINKLTDDEKIKVECLYDKQMRAKPKCKCDLEGEFCFTHNRAGKKLKQCNLEEGCESCQ